MALPAQATRGLGALPAVLVDGRWPAELSHRQRHAALPLCWGYRRLRPTYGPSRIVGEGYAGSAASQVAGTATRSARASPGSTPTTRLATPGPSGAAVLTVRAKSQPGGLSGDAARIRCSSPRLSEIAWTSTIASPRAGSGSGTSWRAIPPRAAGSACGVHKVHQRPDLISTPVAGTPSASKSPHPDRSDPDRAEPGHCRMPRISLRCTDYRPSPCGSVRPRTGWG